jgi:hypothetical protein
VSNTLASNNRQFTPNLAGTPLVNITAVPQQLPISPLGSTLVNTSSIPVTLATDAITNAANSFVLAANGASLPIPVGPLWASIPSTFGGLANLLVIPGMFNIFNPNVLAMVPPTTNLFDETLTLPGLAPVNPFNLGLTANLPGGIINMTPNTHTLILQASAIVQANPVVVVTGAQSNIVYYNQPFYLGLTGFPANPYAVIPVNPGLDTGVIITVNDFKGSVLPPPAMVTYNITSDSDQYTESVFYNGPTKAVIATQAGTGTTIVLNGPARLLTAALFGSNPGAGAGVNLNLDGETFISAGGINNVAVTVGFPVNTILKAGSSIAVVSTAAAENAFGEITYAYP